MRGNGIFHKRSRFKHGPLLIMKKVLIILISVALTASCTHMQEERQNLLLKLNVSAKPQETKTTIKGSSIRYSDNDTIMVVCEGYNKILANNTGTAAIDVFCGFFSRSKRKGEDCNWYAVYPANASVSDEGVIRGTLPCTQIAPFDRRANFMHSDIVVSNYDEDDLPSLSFSMNQMMGIIRISFINTNAEYAEDLLESVQIRTNTTMTGCFVSDVRSSSVTFDGDEQRYVTSLYNTPEVLGVGETHWVVVFVNPVTFASNKLIIRTNKHTFTYISSYSLTPVQGALTALPLMDLASFNIEGPTYLKKRVVCWGDSLTSLEDITYTQNLQRLLGNDWIVYNGGISGNRTDEISARQGALPIVTGSSFTIPAGTESIKIDGVLKTHQILGEEGFFNIRRFWGALTNPCALVGTNGETVLCDIESNRSISGTDTTYYATLKRKNAGEPVEIAEHTPIQTYAARKLRDVDLTIIYMGTNGYIGSNNPNARYRYSRFDNLIEQHWEMINFTDHPESYLVLGIHWSPQWQSLYNYEDQFHAAFGNRFLSLRVPVVQDAESCKSWLVYSGAYTDKSQIPQSSLDRAAKGIWPIELMKDSQHPNQYGAEVMAKLVYDRMVELGYLDN